MSTIKIFDQKGGMNNLGLGLGLDEFITKGQLEKDEELTKLTFFNNDRSKEIVPILEKINGKSFDGISTDLDVTPETDINIIYTLLNNVLKLTKEDGLSDEQYRQLGGIMFYLSAIVKNSLQKNITHTKDLIEAQGEYKKELEDALDLMFKKRKNLLDLGLNKNKIKKEVGEAQIKLDALKPEIQKVKELQELSNEDKEILKNKVNETYKSIKTITNYIIDVYENEYKTKYLKYKEKYINLKKELEAGSPRNKKDAVIIAEKKIQPLDENTKKMVADAIKKNRFARSLNTESLEILYNAESDSLMEAIRDSTKSEEQIKNNIKDLFEYTSLLINKTNYLNGEQLKEKEEAEAQIKKLNEKIKDKRKTFKSNNNRKEIQTEIYKLNKEMKDIIKINKQQEKDEENLEKSDKEKVTLSEKYKNILSATQNLAKALID